MPRGLGYREEGAPRDPAGCLRPGTAPCPAEWTCRAVLQNVKEPCRPSSGTPKVTATSPEVQAARSSCSRAVSPAQSSGSRPGTPTLRKCSPTAEPPGTGHQLSPRRT